MSPSMVLHHASPRFLSTSGKSSILGQLAAFSQGKLNQEASSHQPDLRRCLGYHGVLKRCAIAAQEDKTQQVITQSPTASTQSIPVNNPKRELKASPIRTQITNAIKVMAQRHAESLNMAEDNSLLRFHAREAQKPTKSEIRRRYSASKILLNLKPFSRHKQTMDDNAIG